MNSHASVGGKTVEGHDVWKRGVCSLLVAMPQRDLNPSRRAARISSFAIC